MSPCLKTHNAVHLVGLDDPITFPSAQKEPPYTLAVTPHS